MKRRANRRKGARRKSLPRWIAGNGAAFIARNPIAVGGGGAFLFTLFFVSANALWYQPHTHQDAFFPTRASGVDAPARIGDGGPPAVVPRELETTIRMEREDAAPAPGDPVIQRVQAILRDLDLYAGSVDGVAGPETRDAIRDYRRIMGLEQIGEIDEALLDQLGAGPADRTVSTTPLPITRPPAATPEADKGERRGSIVARVQGGLRAFGNDHIEVDGITGPQTREAIREFQALFGLEPTGEADEAVLSKMRDLGLAG